MTKSRMASATGRHGTRKRGAQGSTRAERPKRGAGSVSKESEPSKGSRRLKENRQSAIVPEVLDRTVIAIHLLNWFNDPKHPEPYNIVVDLNLNFRDELKGGGKHRSTAPS